MADVTNVFRWVAAVHLVCVVLTPVPALPVSACNGIDRFFPECILPGRMQSIEELLPQDGGHHDNRLVINFLASQLSPSPSPPPSPSQSPRLDFPLEEAAMLKPPDHVIRNDDSALQPLTLKNEGQLGQTRVDRQLDAKDSLKTLSQIDKNKNNNNDGSNNNNTNSNNKDHKRVPNSPILAMIGRAPIETSADNSDRTEVLAPQSQSPSPSQSPLALPPPLLQLILHEIPTQEPAKTPGRGEPTRATSFRRKPPPRRTKTALRPKNTHQKFPYKKVAAENSQTNSGKAQPRFDKKSDRKSKEREKRHSDRGRPVSSAASRHPVYRLLQELFGI